jgi:putative two-component system response regulator
VKTRFEGFEVGLTIFLNKPIFPEELFARVKSLIRLKEFTDELDNAEAVLCSLGRSVESRDPYTRDTASGSLPTQDSLVFILDLKMTKLWLCGAGGFLHDLGKVAIPDADPEKARYADGGRVEPHAAAPRKSVRTSVAPLGPCAWYCRSSAPP